MGIGAIHNYYEALVREYLMSTVLKGEEINQDFLEDVACLALNRLPAQYVRDDVTMAFYMSTRRRERMQKQVVEAVLAALEQVSHDQRRH